MSRIVPINISKNNQPSENTVSQQSQVNLRKCVELSELTQSVQVFKKKSIKINSSHNEALQCRICLQSEEQSQQIFIQPCQCTGSVQSVHETCFTEWISRSLGSKSNRQLHKISKEGIQCDLCKMKFEIKFSFEKTCINMEKFKQKVKRRQCEFITLCVMMLASLVLFAVTTALLPQDVFNISFDQKFNHQSNSNQKQGWLKVVLLCSLGILLTIVSLIAYLLISQYGFAYRTQFGYKGKQIKTIKGIVME